MPRPPLLEVRGIRKRFPGVQALDGVSLHARRRRGAGRRRRERGRQVHADEDPRRRLPARRRRGAARRPAGAASPASPTPCGRGIVLIHQELNLAENLERRGQPVPRPRDDSAAARSAGSTAAPMDREAEALLAPRRPGRAAGPRRSASCRSASSSSSRSPAPCRWTPRVIIMDEPTSSLTQRETDRLFEVIADLKRAGVAVLYISHRLAEVQARRRPRRRCCATAATPASWRATQISHDAMVRLMVGRDLKQFYPRQHPPPADGAGCGWRCAACATRGGPAAPVSFARARRRDRRHGRAGRRGPDRAGRGAVRRPAASPPARCCSTAGRSRIRSPARRDRRRAAAGPGGPPAARPGPAGQRRAQPEPAEPRPAQRRCGWWSAGREADLAAAT